MVAWAEIDDRCDASPAYTAWMLCTPSGSLKAAVAWPCAFRSDWPRMRPSSSKLTTPTAGASSERSVTVTVGCPVELTESVVRVAAVCAIAADGSKEKLNANPSQAIRLSRNPRRVMPVTCTCSKFPDKGFPERRAAKPVHPLRRTLLYPARRGVDYVAWPAGVEDWNRVMAGKLNQLMGSMTGTPSPQPLPAHSD